MSAAGWHDPDPRYIDDPRILRLSDSANTFTAVALGCLLAILLAFAYTVGEDRRCEALAGQPQALARHGCPR